MVGERKLITLIINIFFTSCVTMSLRNRSTNLEERQDATFMMALEKSTEMMNTLMVNMNERMDRQEDKIATS